MKWIVGIVLLSAIGAGVFYAWSVSGQVKAATDAAAQAKATVADARTKVAQAQVTTDAAVKAVANAAAAQAKVKAAATPLLWEREESSQFPHPMRYQRRDLPGYEGEYEIVPQAWVEGESNCRVTNGSVRVCSGMWKGYADLVTSPVPKCGAAVKKGAASTACATPPPPATSASPPAPPATPASTAPAASVAPAASATPATPSGGAVAPPVPATSGPAATVGGGV